MIIAASSCQTEGLNEEIELNNQLIGITSAHNARQLGGYHIGRKTLDKVDAEYGSLRNYLTECLGVTPEMMNILRKRYLE